MIENEILAAAYEFLLKTVLGTSAVMERILN